MAKRVTQLTIREERNENSSSFPQVKISDDGLLVFEGVDTGKEVEKFFGDSDFEYWLRVKAEDKDSVLLYLIKSHFPSVHAFKAWLAERDIEASFTSY